MWGYRLTQGLHVAAGTACVPLLLVKLWTVYPRFWIRPPRPSRELLLHVAERTSVGVLVAAAIFQLATGLANVTTWYPWSFSFRSTHFAVAWVVIGALVVHIAVKLPVVREALAGPVDQDEPPGDGLSRRGLVRTAGIASAAAVLLTVGGTVPWLRKVSVFSVRSGDGPQDLPVNKSARAAGVTASATDPAYRLDVVYGDQSTVADPGRPPRDAADGGRPADRLRRGLERPRRLERRAAARPARPRSGRRAGRRSRCPRSRSTGRFRVTDLPAQFADDDLTLLALGLGGEALSIDHGYPARLIAPNRPGVLQTKWVSRLEVEA